MRLKTLKILCHGHDLNWEEVAGTYYEKKLQKIDQKEFSTEKAINKKGYKWYVKWKGYNNSFIVGQIKKHSINKWIFSKTEICRSKCKSWIRFI